MIEKNTNIPFRNSEIFCRRSAGTHIPLLRAIPKLFEVFTVLEYGSGIFSLKTFLDRKYYNKLIKLKSYEKSEIWASYLKSKFKDSRWTINLVYKVGDDIGNFSPDLIFVDGPSDERKCVLDFFKDSKSLVVLHDYNTEKDNCGKEIERFSHKFVYNPPVYNSTVLLSNKIDVSNLPFEIEWQDDFMRWV